MGKNEVGYIMPSTKRTLQSDLHVDYINAVENIRGTPARINCYQSVFCKILRDYTETHGELLISDDGKEIYFARDGTPLTDFGAIPLSVIHQYSEDGVDDYLELLILGRRIDRLRQYAGRQDFFSQIIIAKIIFYHFIDEQKNDVISELPLKVWQYLERPCYLGHPVAICLCEIKK